MNLLKDRWIDVIMRDGSRKTVAPHEIIDRDIIRVDELSIRNGVVTLFLIAIFQLFNAPADDTAWEKKFKNPGRINFEQYFDMFELITPEGVPAAFQWPVKIPEEKIENAHRLIFGNLSDISKKVGKEIFMASEEVGNCCIKCTAINLMSVQMLGLSPGGGYTFGMRIPGAITTIITGENLWETIMLNTLTAEEWKNTFKKPLNPNFSLPWVKHIKPKVEGNFLSPSDVPNEVMYLQTPMKVKLLSGTERGICSVCGINGELITTMKRDTTSEDIPGSKLKNKYDYLNFIFPLSTYSEPFEKKKGGKTTMVKVKVMEPICFADSGKNSVSDLTYRNYPTILNSGKNTILGLYEKKARIISGNRPIPPRRVRAFGYKLAQAEVRCYVDGTVPLFQTAAKINDANHLSGIVTDMVEIIKKSIVDAIKSARKTNKVNGNIIGRRINDAILSFYRNTEVEFYGYVERLSSTSGKMKYVVETEWLRFIYNGGKDVINKIMTSRLPEVHAKAIFNFNEGVNEKWKNRL